MLIDNGATRLLVVKGAPEDIIKLSVEYEAGDGNACPSTNDAREKLAQGFERLGEQGLSRAWRGVPFRAASHDSAVVGDEAELTFSGFITFVDPPKADAAAAIKALAAIGVEVKILTGDNEQVARHLCNAIGVPVKGALTGPDLVHMTEEALRARLASVNLFCRVSPQQKERILLALKQTGKVVGFLGDGINDASALHAADVGISVESAADVAKEAADLVLLERDLGVVHDGVIEGRRTVENVTKYILMGASSNFGNMFSMAGAALFLPYLPMLPTQVLLNNLLYDVSEVGVPFDHVDAEALRKPVRWNIKFIERVMLVLGPVSSLFDFLTFFALLWLFGASEPMFQTGWFIESLATQSLVIFVIRTRKAPWRSFPHPLLTVLTIGVVLVGLLIPLTPLGPVFGFVVPPLGYYLFLAAAVTAYLLLVEVVKRLLYRSRARGAALAPQDNADEKADPKRDAERLGRFALHGILDCRQRLARRILGTFGLMPARFGDRAGQAFDVLAQGMQMLGDLVDLFAQGMMGRHFGVFGGHLSYSSASFRLPDWRMLCFPRQGVLRVDGNQRSWADAYVPRRVRNG